MLRRDIILRLPDINRLELVLVPEFKQILRQAKRCPYIINLRRDDLVRSFQKRGPNCRLAVLISPREESVLLGLLVLERYELVLEPEDDLLKDFGPVAHLLKAGVGGDPDDPGAEEFREVGVLVLLSDVPRDQITRGFESSLVLGFDALV